MLCSLLACPPGPPPEPLLRCSRSCPAHLWHALLALPPNPCSGAVAHALLTFGMPSWPSARTPAPVQSVMPCSPLACPPGPPPEPLLRCSRSCQLLPRLDPQAPGPVGGGHRLLAGGAHLAEEHRRGGGADQHLGAL